MQNELIDALIREGRGATIADLTDMVQEFDRIAGAAYTPIFTKKQQQPMRILPILYTSDMILAIQAGRKTVTRRLIKPQPSPSVNRLDYVRFEGTFGGIARLYEGTPHGLQQFLGDPARQICRYGNPGDKLWIRETWAPCVRCDSGYAYRAGDPDPKGHVAIRWKPCIHMPKEACRLFQEIISVRAERLQDITDEDAVREGILSTTDDWDGSVAYKDYFSDASGYGDPAVDFPTYATPVFSYRSLWYKIHSKKSWEQNPWVWRIETKVVNAPEGWPL